MITKTVIVVLNYGSTHRSSIEFLDKRYLSIYINVVLDLYCGLNNWFGKGTRMYLKFELCFVNLCVCVCMWRPLTRIYCVKIIFGTWSNCWPEGHLLKIEILQFFFCFTNRIRVFNLKILCVLRIQGLLES